MRLLLLLPILIACQTPPIIVDPPPPPPTDLIRLETNPLPENFVLARGASRTLTITGKLLSPAAKKIKISISLSPGIEVDPSSFTLDGNSSANVTVRVPQDATDNKPFFRVNGQALDSNNNNVTSNVPSILFQWTVPPPPAP